ncbi:hypothetical protein [Nocardioides sp. GXQ0305]|uniref:hypothetical protein n=1 Tax=Nocardioides sp. GXQ0305 TaxID=3423912 RepID=UPI003D7D0AA4
MRRLLTLLSLLLAILAVPATTAPAFAKGATEVTVTGPGIDDRRLGFTQRTDDVDVGSLSEAAGIYGIFGDGQLGDHPDLTSADLGPRYTLSWYEGDTLMIVSHAYPFAEGGAWAEVPDGQRLWGEPLAAGWWAGGTELTRQLVSLGATEPAGAADPVDGADAAVAAESPPATPPTSSPGLALVVTGSAVLVGLGLLAGTGWWFRRRRGLHPARPV